jgi:hypothetical protein
VVAAGLITAALFELRLGELAIAVAANTARITKLEAVVQPPAQRGTDPSR